MDVHTCSIVCTIADCIYLCMYTGPSCGNGDGHIITSVSEKWCPPVAKDNNSQDPVSSQSSKDTSPLKRKFDEQQLPGTSIIDNIPAKKQKLPTIPEDVLLAATPETEQQQQQQQPSRTKDTDETLATSQSQLERNPDAPSFLPLSQPAHSSKKVEAGSKSLSQSSDSRSRKGSMHAWRIDLPESFYSMTRSRSTPEMVNKEYISTN